MSEELSPLAEDMIRLQALIEILKEKGIISKSELKTKFDKMIVDFNKFRKTETQESQS